MATGIRSTAATGGMRGTGRDRLLQVRAGSPPVTMANNTSRATGAATAVVLLTTTAGIATAIATGATTTGTTVIGTGIAASPETGARADPLLRRASLAPCAAPVG